MGTRNCRSPRSPRRRLTTSNDGTARLCDATTGAPCDWMLEQLPDGEAVVRSQPDGRVLGASPDAWRWLGWLVTVDGAVTRLPAETYGPLPPLRHGLPSHDASKCDDDSGGGRP